ncbi:MAG: PA2779 family protein [Gammaproteobacteria bacterium]
MKLPRSVTRNIARAMLICFAPFALFAPVAQAGMIGTDQIISSTQTQSDRAHLIESLSRADLADQLRSAGVDPVQLQDRVASLTDAEVAMLNTQLDELPAGGGILETAVFIFVVLLITDVLGYTEIFPFVKKTVN